MDRWMDQSMDGWMDGGMDHGVFYEETHIKAWGQWSEDEEEEERRGKWEDVSTAIEFAVEHNGDGGVEYL